MTPVFGAKTRKRRADAKTSSGRYVRGVISYFNQVKHNNPNPKRSLLCELGIWDFTKYIMNIYFNVSMWCLYIFSI